MGGIVDLFLLSSRQEQEFYEGDFDVGRRFMFSYPFLIGSSMASLELLDHFVVPPLSRIRSSLSRGSTNCIALSGGGHTSLVLSYLEGI